jgi:hypothetical protein
MSEENTQQPQAVEPKPNVIWSSERLYKSVTKEGDKEKIQWVARATEDDQQGRLKYGEPPTSPVKIGNLHIKVPSADEQLKGFYSANSERLVRQVNGYKRFVAKG